MLSWLDGVLTLSLSLVKSNATVDCVAFVALEVGEQKSQQLCQDTDRQRCDDAERRIIGWTGEGRKGLWVVECLSQQCQLGEGDKPSNKWVAEKETDNAETWRLSLWFYLLLSRGAFIKFIINIQGP